MNIFEDNDQYPHFYMGLQFHMAEALTESKQKLKASSWPTYALFSKGYCNEIDELNHEKKYDYCFIGSIKSAPEKRKWVIEFAKSHFTSNSVFVNTDKDPNWISLGSFDNSHLNLGYCPKNEPNNQSKHVQYRKVKENVFYFETMCQSKFILCPAGDAPWSFRFYEVLMCKSIPIVETFHHTYRTLEESKINYKYLIYNNLESDKIVYDDYVKENTELFLQYHTCHS